MRKQNRRKFILYSLGILGGVVMTAWFFRRNLIRTYTKMGRCLMEFKSDGVLAFVNGEPTDLLLSVQKDDNSNYLSTCRVGIKTV